MKKISIRDAAGNLLGNWYFPISAAAFYCAIVQWYYDGSFIPKGLGVAFLLCAVFAALVPSIGESVYKIRWQIKGLAAMTATGVFWDPSVIPLGGISLGLKIEYLNSLVVNLRLPALFGDLAMVAAWVFAFICVAILYDKMLEVFLKTGLFRGITVWELVSYSVLLLLSAAAIVFAFSQSSAFYGYGNPGAVLYSSDSNLIVPQSAYLNLFHNENDIRQPLFAVFAAPLTGIAYFLGAWVYRWPTAQMILLDYTQLVLIFCGGFMLAKTLELSPLNRICFMAVFCCSYIYLLFILMMEQYAVAFFWLAFAVYLISNGKAEDFVVLAAGGTLLTSLALVPLAQGKNPRYHFKEWFLGCVRHGVTFLVWMLAFCRLDVFLNLLKRTEMLVTFTGENVSLADRVLQFLTFIPNCLTAPDTYVDMMHEGGPGIVQAVVTNLDVVGLILFALMAVSLWLNRDKVSSMLCGYWAAFSVVMLAIVGWGTPENGLMLYGLYFGWAYIALLFQLIQWVAEKLRKPWLLPVCSGICAAVMLAYNIPEFIDMVRFAATYYPQ